MTDVYESARRTMGSDSNTEQQLSSVNQHARLYFRYTIPYWPPKLLLNKIFRILLKPIMMPQVKFNEAVRDVLNEVHRSQSRQTAAHGEALVTIAELEQQVEYLSGQLASLRHTVALIPTNTSSGGVPDSVSVRNDSVNVSARG